MAGREGRREGMCKAKESGEGQGVMSFLKGEGGYHFKEGFLVK